MITCQWGTDSNIQSWDRFDDLRTGALNIVAVPATDDPNAQTLESIENGKIVYTSPVLPLHEETLRFSFSYSKSNAYYLWYRLGEGIGDSLCVNNFTMSTVIYDDADRWIGRHYQTLSSRGFPLSFTDAFSLRMLRLVVSLLQEENTTVTATHLASFMNTEGLDMSAASMRALEEIANALIDVKTQKQAHDAIGEQERPSPTEVILLDSDSDDDGMVIDMDELDDSDDDDFFDELEEEHPVPRAQDVQALVPVRDDNHAEILDNNGNDIDDGGIEMQV